ncbi:MAG TPA: hypothetical protein DGT21_06960 [Armatimonadetes bacterium]|jgi:hypothetical protein|nr:hypothetical protein [Armatimonadota bacterium]
MTSHAPWLIAVLVPIAALGALIPANCQERRLYRQSAEHPRLLCTAAELEQVRARLGEGVEAIAYRRMLEKCDQYLDPASPHYVNWPERVNIISHQGGEVNIWETRPGAWMLTKRYEELAWAGVLSGEQKYIEGAKNIVLTIIRERVIDRIGGTNYGTPYKGWLAQPLDAGHSSLSLAIFYDLLYNDLTEQERKEVRDYIIDTYFAYLYPYMQGIKDRDDYPAILGHNFALIGNAAGGLMALAIYGETDRGSELEDAWVDLFFEGVEKYLTIGFGVDGGAMEGPGYTSACIYNMAPLIEAMRRAGGPNLFERPELQKAAYYYLYELRPNAAYFNNVNDAYFSAHCSFFPLFASVLDDPALTWLWEVTDGTQREGNTIFGDSYDSWKSALPYVILWHALAPAAVHPDELDLPLSRRYSRRGMVSMRTGWDAEGCLLSFISGGNPDRGHSQMDANHFALYCGASILAYDSGYGARDTDDHNSLLFDGKGQTVYCREGRIDEYHDDGAACYARGRAGDLYGNEALKKLDRHVYFIRGEAGPYAVIYDEVEADGAEHTYTWTLNVTNPNAINLDSERPTIVDEANGWQLDIDLFAAAQPAFTQDLNEVQSSAVSKVQTHPRLRAEVTTNAAPEILAVLWPHRAGADRPQVTRINSHAVRVEFPGYTDIIAFGPAQSDGVTLDGRGFRRLAKE